MQSTGCRKAYVSVNVDVDEEGCVHPRYIRWENGLIFQIDQILYKCRAASKKVGGGGGSLHCADPWKRILSLSRRQQVVRGSKGGL